MRITSKGQVTIPIEVRQQLGFLPNTEVEFRVRGNEAVIQRTKGRRTRGQKLIEHMRGRGDGDMTTDEIMALTRGR
ncbi:MAG: AbrB/MazE/SpoVT family DNA-binding domain-containing protein [Gemmatimonadaceae bacterium]